MEDTKMAEENKNNEIKEENKNNEITEENKSIEVKEEKKLSKKEREEAEDKAEIEAIANSDLKIVTKLLQEIQDDNEKQMKYVRTQLRLTQLSTVVLIAVIVFLLIGVSSYIPKVNALIDDSSAIMKQASGVLTNLDSVTAELADADITGMLDDVDSLVVSSEESMADALKKIEDIDIDTLNSAIKDLESVVKPLAKLFGR
jgi:Fe2+ transport system protein B